MTLESVLLNLSHMTKSTPANPLFRHFLLSSQTVNQFTSGLTTPVYGYKPLNVEAAMKLEDKTAVEQVMKTISIYHAFFNATLCKTNFPHKNVRDLLTLANIWLILFMFRAN